MKKNSLLLIVTILLLGCALLPAAATSTPALVPTVPTPNPLPEPSDRTQVIVVQTSKSFDIVLPSNLSTGYQWQILSLDESLLQSAGQKYIADEPILAGSGGVDVWTFNALAPGQTEIQFGYFSPGDSTQAEETAIFSIEIQQ